MKQKIVWIFCCLLLFGCKKETYENKPVYELKIGETVEIYYSTNSCCTYCFSDKQSLKHLEFLTEKTIDNGPDDCAGCNFVAAYVFKAKSSGIDTVKLKHSVASKYCPESDNPLEEYIVIVK